MSKLDYYALWHRALEEAERRVDLLYPPDAIRKRAIARAEIAERLYRQMAYPTPKWRG